MSDDDKPDEGEGIKNLRKLYDTQQKELAAANERLATFEAKERTSSVAAVLKAKGLPEKAAALYSSDDVSEDAVGKWAVEYQDVFGAKQTTDAPSTQEATAPGLDPALQQAQRVSDASHGSETTFQNIPAGQSQIIADPIEALRQMQTLPYEELQKRGWVPNVAGTLHDTHGR